MMIISYQKKKKKRTHDDLISCAGGFGGNIGHDPHILYTLSAVQVLALFDKLNVLDIDKVTNCILLHTYWWSLKLYYMLFFVV